MGEIKNSTTDKTVAYVSGDGIFNATTGRKSQIIKDGKIYSSITGELIGTYSGGGSGSGGSTEGSGKYRVRFFDYDGTILKTVYTDGGAVTAPNVPEHERLLFQEWNNDFDDITADLDVGAIYTTKSGKCEFDIDINSLTGLTQYIGIRLTSGTVTIEWGDGQSETLSTVGDTIVAHTYAASGKYTIMLSGTSEWRVEKISTDDTGAHVNNLSITAARLVGLIYPQQNGAFAKMCMCKTITVDSSSNRVHQNFFNTAYCLTHFNFPRKFPNEMYMFNTCNALEHIVFAQGETFIKNIGGGGGANYKTCFLPNTLVTISDAAFRGWQFREPVTIPASVTTLGAEAFYNRNVEVTVEKLVMKSTTPVAIQIAFGWNAGGTFPSNGTLKEIIVPAGCGEAYKSATNWSYYADIIKEEEI